MLLEGTREHEATGGLTVTHTPMLRREITNFGMIHFPPLNALTFDLFYSVFFFKVMELRSQHAENALIVQNK